MLMEKKMYTCEHSVCVCVIFFLKHLISKNTLVFYIIYGLFNSFQYFKNDITFEVGETQSYPGYVEPFP